ncbi:MAG: hypothetical protein V3S55_10165 [Nitrospiraceae bacterium]
MARKFENELGEMRTDRGLFIDKGNLAVSVKHRDFNQGAVGDGINDDGVAWNDAVKHLPTEGGTIIVPPGDYLLTTAFSFNSQDNIMLWLMPGVVLTGAALPTATGNNFILDWRAGNVNLSIGAVGTANRISVTAGVIDIDSGYVGQASITTLGTVATGAIPASLVTTGTFGAGNYTFSAIVFINETANGNMTTGLTINQGANDNEILAFKSSDVGHGMTNNAEADTFAAFKKAQDTSGGLLITGFKDADGSAGFAVQIQGYLGEAVSTLKDTNAVGCVVIDGAVKSGSGVGNAGADGNLVVIRNFATTRFIFDAEGTMHSIGATAIDQIGNGLWFINDTANANMTIGLTINQGANDNEAWAVKSSDVAHGMTGIAETDTYGKANKHIAGNGGLQIVGLSDATVGLSLMGFHNTDDTGKTTDDDGAVNINGALRSGTGVTSCGANANLAVIRNNGTTRFIFDAEGESHQDVGTAWINFDDRDDAMMTRSLAIVMDSASVIKSKWDDFGRDHLEDMIECGLVPRLTSAQIARGERALVNTTQVMRLHNGAIWQSHIKQRALEECLRSLVTSNPTLIGSTEALALLEA